MKDFKLEMQKTQICPGPPKNMYSYFSDYQYAFDPQIISLKAPGNYSASSWSNKISVLLYEGPKPPNSVISGFVDPWEPLFVDLNIPNSFLKYTNISGHIFEE